MTLAQPAGADRPLTLGAALERAALEPAAGLRFLDRREHAQWVAWSEIRDAATEISSGLARLGVSPGDRVGLIFPTCRELVEAYFGTVFAGAVPACLPPPPRLGSQEGFRGRTHLMLEAIDARLVLAQERLASRLRDLLPRRPLGCRALRELPPGRAARPANTRADDLAMVQFTSGTTVSPKPVALSHEAILEQARLLNSFWPDQPECEHRGLSWLPLNHDMGLIGCVLTSLERPGEMTLMPPEVFAARPAIWLRAISAFGATVSAATNFAYAYCTERIRDEELEGVDLSGWRIALNGAEPVVGNVIRRFEKRFAPWGFRSSAMTPVYGLAEATLGVTFSKIDEPFGSRRFARESLAVGRAVVESPNGRELVSVGEPLPGFEISIRDSEGRDVGEGVVGRIWASGPTLMAGYLGLERASRETLQDGWLDTGDLGFVLGGELYVSGRAKDVLIVRGRNHSPVEIEQAAEEADGVAAGCAAAVAHLPEGADGEEVVLFVEHRRRLAAEARARLESACRGAVLARTGLEIDRIVVLPADSIERTSSGKIRRAASLERYLAGELDAT